MNSMFVHFNGNRQSFNNRSDKADYYNSLVFLSGDSTELPSIYTRGEFYAADDLLRELETAINDLNYFKGVKVGNTTYDVSGGSYLAIDSSNTGTLSVGVVNNVVKFDVKGLGTSSSTANAKSTEAWGRIKNIENVLSTLTGSGENSIDGIIESAIKGLKDWRTALATESSKDSSSNGISVTVKTKDGSVSGVTVDAPEFLKKSERFTVDEIGTETKDASSNGHKVSVTTTNGKVSAVTLTAPAKFTVNEIGDSSAEDTSNDIYVKVNTSKGKVSSVTVDAPEFLKKSERFTVNEIGTATKDASSNGHSISVTTTNGNVSAVTLTAPAKFTVNEIGTATKDASSNGHSISVTTTNGNVSAVTLTAPAKFTVSEIGNDTKTGADNDISVSVTTTNGKVSDVTVDAPEFLKKSDKFKVSDIGSDTKSNAKNGVSVSVSTTNGKVSAVTVDASTFVKSGELSSSAVTSITSGNTKYLTFDKSKGDVTGNVQISNNQLTTQGLIDASILANIFTWKELS